MRTFSKFREREDKQRYTAQGWSDNNCLFLPDEDVKVSWI